MGSLTLVAYRDGGTYGNVSLFFYAQNLEAQMGLDFNATSTVGPRSRLFYRPCLTGSS